MLRLGGCWDLSFKKIILGGCDFLKCFFKNMYFICIVFLPMLLAALSEGREITLLLLLLWKLCQEVQDQVSWYGNTFIVVYFLTGYLHLIGTCLFSYFCCLSVHFIVLCFLFCK